MADVSAVLRVIRVSAALDVSSMLRPEVHDPITS
jgi:hypothetical protein